MDRKQPVPSSSSALTFGKVIQKYRKQAGISQPKLADLMEISRNTVSNWENDKVIPGTDTVRMLCEILGIPVSELLDIPSDSGINSQETALLQQYRRLSPLGKKITERLIASILQEEEDARDSYLRDSFILLPLESTPAAAGSGSPFADIDPEYFFVKKNRYSAEADALIRVSGASMEPLYQNGDLVYVRYTSRADNGDDVICSTADGVVIKRLKNNTLCSLNQELPYSQKFEDDHVVILGRVLGCLDPKELADEKERSALETLKHKEIREFNRKHGIN